MMKRVTGIGGIFIKSAELQRLRDWYQKHLGIPIEAWGGTAFRWAGTHNPGWPWHHGLEHLRGVVRLLQSPSQAQFMVNYRVDNLHALLAALRAEGCQVEGQGGRIRVRQVRLGGRSGRQQDRVVGAAGRAVAMVANEAVPSFSGSIPEVYDKYLVPLIFEPYAIDLAQRVAALPLTNVLELAAGTGVVTRRLAMSLPASVFIIATDLHQPMLDLAAAVGTAGRSNGARRMRSSCRIDKASFDVVVCQFGVMFFADRPRAFAEARRVLRRGGVFIFNVWDRIEENEFAQLVTEALAGVFPADPPRFMARVPHGYHDIDTIRRDLAAGGFSAAAQVTTLAERSRAACGAYPGGGLLPGHAVAERDRGA